MTEDRLEIRPVAQRDLDDLIALYTDDILGRTRESAGPEDREAYLKAFERVAADASTCVYVALADRALGGTFQLTITPGISRRGVIRATIESVRTRTDLRGQGIGARMMTYAVEEARRRGADIVQLTSDLAREDAHRFYERLGFERTHAGYKLLLRR
ncbi:MAG: GNAT family N-acetyltransferase [Beijerinckiaceae bacterium]